MTFVYLLIGYYVVGLVIVHPMALELWNDDSEFMHHFMSVVMPVYWPMIVVGYSDLLSNDWRKLYGHRKSEAHPESGTRALPAGPSGERAGGTIAPTDYGVAGVGTEPQRVTEEIIAWRGWAVEHDESGWFLRSISQGTRWDGPVLVADEVPSEQSGHGIYALREKWLVFDRHYGNYCVGQVALSGIVLEGTTGYRAEKAVVRSLTFFGYPAPGARPIEIMADLSARYQCDAEWEQREEKAWQSFQQQAAYQMQQYLAYQNQATVNTAHNYTVRYV